MKTNRTTNRSGMINSHLIESSVKKDLSKVKNAFLEFTKKLKLMECGRFYKLILTLITPLYVMINVDLS